MLRQLPKMKQGHILIETLVILCSMVSAEMFQRHPVNVSVHMQKYRPWTEKRLASLKSEGGPLFGDTSELFQLDPSGERAMINHLLAVSPGFQVHRPAKAIYRVCESMEAVWLGELEILDALLGDGVLKEFYKFINSDCDAYMQFLVHNKPTLRILEIGAGTGGLTALVLKSLQSRYGESLYSKYTYKDISAGFFVAAKERFKDQANREFAVLHISQDLIAQYFENETYDLIISSNVLHATPKLEETLKHCRSLLHTRGRLFLQELCLEAKWVNYIMGTLPGWFGEEDGRADEAYVYEEKWHHNLQKASF